MRLQTALAVLIPLAVVGAMAHSHLLRQRVNPVQRIMRVSRLRRIRREDSTEPAEVSGFGGGEFHPTRDDPKFSLEVKFMSRRAAIEECARLGAWRDGKMPKREGGCALFYLDRQHCVVIAPEIQDVDDAATAVLGHEVAHCALGRYHDE
jgi:hypothetical protein